jgi:cell division protein FtsB
MQTILKKTIKEKIILDREHQKIVTELDGTIDRLEKELHEIKNIDKNHQRINGLLRKDVDKLTKENEQLKKENQIIREGNDYLGIYSTKLIDEVKKLNDDMTETIKVAEPLVKKNNRNIMFMTSIQGLIRYNTRLNEIYKKLKKN